MDESKENIVFDDSKMSGVQAGYIVPERTPKQKVQDELADLKIKMHNLQEFLFGEKIIEADLSQEMVRLLDAQLVVMKNYAAILQNRLAIWDRKDRQPFYHEFFTHH